MLGWRQSFLVLAISMTAPTTANAQYKVSGVAANDVLNIRSAPDADSKIVGRIPPNGRGIRILGGGNKYWVKVSFGGKSGFVNRRFIRPDALAASASKVATRTKTATPASRRATKDPLDEAYAGPAPVPSASVTVQPDALPPVAPQPAAPKQSAARAPGGQKKETRTPAMTRENLLGKETPPANELPSSTVLAAPATVPTDAGQAPKTLLAPPMEMMTQALPNAMACGGDDPVWSLSIANGVSSFVSAETKEVLEFAELKQSAAQTNVWMAGGRNFGSQLSLHLRRTDACRSITMATAAPYEISLRLHDGRVLTGCCRGGN